MSSYSDEYIKGSLKTSSQPLVELCLLVSPFHAVMERSGALGKTHLMCGSWDAIVRISLLFENSRPLSPSPWANMTVAVCFVFGVMVTNVSGKDIISLEGAVLEQRALDKRMPRVGNLNPTLRPHSHSFSLAGKDAVIYASAGLCRGGSHTNISRTSGTIFTSSSNSKTPKESICLKFV